MEEGGIDIRSSHDINNALALKLMWKYLQQKCLWAVFTKVNTANKYIFWIITADTNSSISWEVILKERQQSHGLVEKRINGKNTNLSFYPWVQGEFLLHTLE